MKIIATIFLVALLLTATGYSVQDFYAVLRGSVVQLDLVTPQGLVVTGGNGFQLCDLRGYAITAWHVVTLEGLPINELDISQFGAGGKFKTQLIYRSEKSDVAVVRIPYGMVIRGCLQLGTLKWGRDSTPAYYVAALPFFDEPLKSLGWSDFWKSASGEISSCCKSYRDLIPEIGGRWGGLAHANMPIWRGASGAPIIQDERLAGMVVGSLAAGIDTLIIPAYQIEEAVKEAKELIVR